MALFKPDSKDFGDLQDTVVVVTGNYANDGK
jgi:hypothetical protein